MEIWILCCLGANILCFLLMIMFFSLMYFYKIKYLEIIVTLFWMGTCICTAFGLFVCGVLLVGSVLTYETSLSLNTFLTSSTSYANLPVFLASTAATYTTNCVFSSTTSVSATMGSILSLTDYLNKANSITTYLSSIKNSIGTTTFPDLVATYQIRSCNEYLSDIETLSAPNASKRLALLNSCLTSNSCDC